MSRRPLPEEPDFGRLDAAARFPTAYFESRVTEVARDLLGACLISTIGGRYCAGVIVETEAYGGREDPASHAATVRGVTPRNRAMFGAGGHAYVYRSYGVHWCVNVVTGREGEGEAVLIRGLQPIEGIEVMMERRSGRRPLAAGPGRLCQALGITDAHYGHDLSGPPLLLHPGWSVGDDRAGTSGRIGVSVGAEWPYRFYVRGAPGVSRPESRLSQPLDRP